jgi:hypothetical protein
MDGNRHEFIALDAPAGQTFWQGSEATGNDSEKHTAKKM